MIYSNAILNGLGYLRRHQNADGGIPATKPGDVSGCWTSAETLEALLLSPYHTVGKRSFALPLLRFLITSQITKKGNDTGGWPLVVSRGTASTMATGHATAALVIAKRFFHDDQELIQEIDPVIEKGFYWLKRNKNTEGGWGVEPSGGAGGNSPRMISTGYALRAYFENGFTVETSRTVRDAVNWVKKLVNTDGGAGGYISGASDACNTARAITIFLRSGHSKRKDKLISEAINYIESTRPKGKLWNLDTETYVTEGAPGQTVYNSNTIYDVLDAFLRVGFFNRHVDDLVSWYLEQQEDDGSWSLGTNDVFEPDLITWPTNEALLTLILAAPVFVQERLPAIQRSVTRYRRVAISLFLIALFELMFIVELPGLATDLWNQIPQPIRDILVGGVFIALVVNLVSSFLYDRINLRKGK